MTTTKVELRKYQQEAVDSVFAFWEKAGRGKNPIIEAPTGGGKTAIIAELCRVIAGEYGGRVLVVTHRKELLSQNEGMLFRLWPEGRGKVAVYSAGLNRREIRDVTFAGIQSIYNKASRLGHVDVVIVDECHRVAEDEDSQYQKLFDGLRKKNDDVRIVGLSATPYRLGQGYLTQGDNAIFHSVCYKIEVKELIDAGYLCPVFSRKTTGKIDLANVGTRMGEYVTADLERAASVFEVCDAVVNDVEHAFVGGRMKAMVFGVSVDHCRTMLPMFLMAGHRADMVTGETPSDERARILERFKTHDLNVLISCDVLTTGFDNPQVDVIALVRATQSTALYVQIIGRGMRTAIGKNYCEVLDYGGNIARHGPIDKVEVKEKSTAKETKAPMKVCPRCEAQLPISVSSCEYCGHDFPPPERKVNRTPSGLPILSWQADGTPNRTRHTVGRVAFRRHVKKGFEFDETVPTTMHVQYFARAESGHADDVGRNNRWEKAEAQEWVCFEHTGFARGKAEGWWRDNVTDPSVPCPHDVNEAIGLLSGGLMRKVNAVETEVDPGNDKFRRIVAVTYDAQTQTQTSTNEKQQTEAQQKQNKKQDDDDDDDLPW